MSCLQAGLEWTFQAVWCTGCFPSYVFTCNAALMLVFPTLIHSWYTSEQSRQIKIVKKKKKKKRISSGSGIFAENPGCNPPPLSFACPRWAFQLCLRSSLAPFRFCKWWPWLTSGLLHACTAPGVMIATTTPAYPGASHRSFGTQSVTGFHLTLDTAIRQALTVSKVSVYTAGRQ